MITTQGWAGPPMHRKLPVTLIRLTLRAPTAVTAKIGIATSTY